MTKHKIPVTSTAGRNGSTVVLDEEKEPLDTEWLRQRVVDAGADDVGFVQIDRPEIDDQRDDILQAFPHTQTLISFVVRLNREPIRTPVRSVANLEFHHAGDHVNEVGRSDFTGWRLQLFGLLLAQLSGVHGRVHRLDRTSSREQKRCRLPQTRQRP